MLFVACPDDVLDSLGREIGDGSTVTSDQARSILLSAETASGRNPDCEASKRLEEIIFDMETIIDAINNRTTKR
jgi:pyruvate kinase